MSRTRLARERTATSASMERASFAPASTAWATLLIAAALVLLVRFGMALAHLYQTLLSQLVGTG